MRSACSFLRSYPILASMCLPDELQSRCAAILVVLDPACDDEAVALIEPLGRIVGVGDEAHDLIAFLKEFGFEDIQCLVTDTAAVKVRMDGELRDVGVNAGPRLIGDVSDVLVFRADHEDHRSLYLFENIGWIGDRQIGRRLYASGYQGIGGNIIRCGGLQFDSKIFHIFQGWI